MDRLGMKVEIVLQRGHGMKGVGKHAISKFIRLEIIKIAVQNSNVAAVFEYFKESQVEEES